MSAGKTIKSFPVLYKDDLISMIRVVQYLATDCYAFEFIGNKGLPDDPSTRHTIIRKTSKVKAMNAANQRHKIRMTEGWISNNDIFKGIIKKASEEEISEFLDKYGKI